MKRFSRVLSMLLAIVMVVGLLPLSIWAEDTKTTHTVQFKLNYNGASTIATQTVADGACATQPDGVVRTGWNFQYWYIRTTDGNVKFDLATPVTEDLVLYARWDENVNYWGPIWDSSLRNVVDTPEEPDEEEPGDGVYTVTFVCGDGDVGNAPKAQTVKKGECAIEPTTPTRTGYMFDGWYTDEKYAVVYNFSSAVTANITLYAKWTVYDGTPEDVADTYDTVVTENDVYVLSANSREVLAESSTEVVFYVNSTLTVPYFELYCDGNPLNIKLYDDGDFNDHHDDIPHDGCYSGSVIIDYDIETDYHFSAKAIVDKTPITTNVIQIFVYYEITDEEIQAMDFIENELQSIINETRNNNPNLPLNDILELLYSNIIKYLKEAEKNDLVYGIIGDKENYIISYKLVSGISAGVQYYHPENSIQEFEDGVVGNSTSSGASESNSTAYSVITDTNYITYREKALLLCYESLNSGWNGGSQEDGTSNLTVSLSNAGFDVTSRYSVTVNDFKNMQNYDYIHISCHGTVYTLWTSPFTYQKTPVICTPQNATSANKKQYSSDIKKDRIVIVNGQYYIRPSFFDFYYDDDNLKANIVQLGCCKGGLTDELAKSIVNAGASAVLAYSETVYTAYDYYMSDSILSGLYDGYTISAALQLAKNEYGEDDLVWGAQEAANGNTNFTTLKSERARLRLFGDTDQKLHHNLLNGDFDSLWNLLGSGLSGWKSIGDARSIFKLSGLTPKSSPKMAIISSGFGSMDGETTSFIYQTFLVPVTADSITFSYDVVSEEPMEFVGTQFNDTFKVELLDTDGNVLETLAMESVNTSTWYAIDGIDFPGGDDTTYHTRWTTVTSDVIQNYRSQLVVLRISVEDAGDSIYDTAALIDSITIN